MNTDKIISYECSYQVVFEIKKIDMIYYSYLKRDFSHEAEKKKEVAENLLRLKKQLAETVPDKDIYNHLLLATWNIRDFAKINRRGFGNRTKDSHYYIAEIISSFDLVAIQEVNEIEELEKVMRLLGHDWDYIATDVADSKNGGNGERMTFVYDKRKVWFKNIAGEIVLPPSLLISKTVYEIDGKKVLDGKQFRRTPFVVSFQAGWFKFDISTVHIYYGNGKEGIEQRIEEINGIAKYLGERADKAMKENKATILLGDFNIISPEHDTMKALENFGFKIPEQIKKRKTNVIETKHYDQIAFRSEDDIIGFVNKVDSDPKKCNAGVFSFFKSVFRENDFEFYKDEILKSKNANGLNEEKLKKYYQSKWRTYQMSDHNPLWVKLEINDSVGYLEGI